MCVVHVRPPDLVCFNKASLTYCLSGNKIKQVEDFKYLFFYLYVFGTKDSNLMGAILECFLLSQESSQTK